MPSQLCTRLQPSVLHHEGVEIERHRHVRYRLRTAVLGNDPERPGTDEGVRP